MKKYLLATLLLCLSIFAHADGGDKYVNAMKGVLSMMDTATTMQTMQNCANRFERIGNAEKKEWLPYYYVALSHVIMSYMEPDNETKDALLDKADENWDKANDMKVNDVEKAELVLLRGMIYGSRIQIDPQTRGMKYGPLSGQQYGRAMGIDPKNPRAEYLQGQSLLFTPEMWGGGRDKAIPLLESAIKKFDEWESPNEIHPDWGKDDAVKLLEFAKSGKKAPWEEGGEEEGMEEGAEEATEEIELEPEKE